MADLTLLPTRSAIRAPRRTELDERAAREDLRRQIARLESQLGALFCSAFPRAGFDWQTGSRGGPALLSLGELEQLRDELVARAHAIRIELGWRARAEADQRVLLERMMLEPAEYKWVRVRSEDIGAPGCTSWHVRPRLGLVGMLLGWWRVVVSSGCPLAKGRGRAPRPAPNSPRHRLERRS